MRRPLPAAVTTAALPAAAVTAAACAGVALAASRSVVLVAATAVLVTAVALVLRCPREAFVGLAGCGVVALLVVVPVQRASVLGSRFQLLVPALLVLVVLVLLVQRGRRLPGAWYRTPGLLAAFVLLSVLTTWPGDEPTWRWVAPLFTSLLCGLVLGLLALPAERRDLVATVVVLALVQALYAVYEVLARPAPLWAAAGKRLDGSDVVLPNELLGAGFGRAQALMGHPLPLALLLLVALGLLLRTGAQLPRTLRVAAIVVLVLGIAAAGSRSGMVIATGTILFAAPKRPSTGVITGVYLGGLLLAGLAEVGFFASNTVAVFLNGGSLNHRLGALDAVGRLLAASSTAQVLLGHGYDSVARLFDSGLLQTDGFETIDNQLVTTFAKTGVVGVLLLVAAVTSAFVDGVRRWGPALAVTVAMFLSFEVLEWSSSALLLGLLLGLCTADGDLRASRWSPGPPDPAGGALRPAPAGAELEPVP